MTEQRIIYEKFLDVLTKPESCGIIKPETKESEGGEGLAENRRFGKHKSCGPMKGILQCTRVDFPG